MADADAVVGRLGELGFELPRSQATVTKYRWAVRDGDVVHLAGHGPFVDGSPRFQGKVGRDLTIEQGYEANRVTALAILRTLKDELGSLERVVRPLSQVNYVNLVEGYPAEFIEVGNGSTDLWSDLWGEDVALCARITVGVAELPMGVPTAITSVWKVR
ncbi:MAG TPA: RidA family protein [Solirubrobacteraceae bacterium]|nr:RidA family protein [Solirubrobacteraceae bacterium]